jgi:two-component system copper resistance phosphate regulon response regulator CusR
MTKVSCSCHSAVSGRIVPRCEMRILVIEDEPRILAFLSRGLEAEGFAVHGARDGVEGLRRALVEVYDLVVLDLLLPRLDGLSMLRELVQQRPELPVVVVSARADVPTKLRAFGLGAHDYLAKPFSFDELVARIRARLRRPLDAPDGHVLLAGHMALDVARRQVRVGDDDVLLTTREFRLLHHLALHAGEVVTRESILSEVWGYQFDPGSNVVEVCVGRLRKKLGPGAPIETVRHVGYRLAA